MGESLGLFVGENLVKLDRGGGLPAQIILYLENIWWEADEDEPSTAGRSAPRLYHELGHYLGLEETDLKSADFMTAVS